LSYDVINDVIMSDADCTPSRELRSVAASFNLHCMSCVHAVFHRVDSLAVLLNVVLMAEFLSIVNSFSFAADGRAEYCNEHAIVCMSV